MADVEAMYLQVKIPLKDRNALRFLWLDGEMIVEYRMTSHLFGGVWCAGSSTYALRRTVLDSPVPVDELIKDTINESFYVDDLLKSVKSFDEAKQVIFETKRVLQHGGFNLTKFVVNHPQLLQKIDVGDRAKEVKEISSQLHSRALGIKWDVGQDNFYYVSKCEEINGDITKRQMLSQLSSIYDPLGLISPIVLVGNCFSKK